jgi:hypothetical protein
VSTEGVAAVAGLVTAWLVLAVLTVAGARRRGERWPLALVSGLLFPVTWVRWYLVDARQGHKAGA